MIRRILIIGLLLILIAGPVQAVKVQIKNMGGTDWITAVGSGITGNNVVKCSDPICDDIEPKNPASHRIAWRWNDGSPDTAPTGAVIEPSPAEALDRFIEHTTNLTGSKQTAYAELSKRPALLITILSGRYEDTKLILDALVDDGTLKVSQAQQFKDILDGKFIPK